MARRRRFGAGIAAASENVTDFLGKKLMADYQSNLIGTRQRELAELQGRNQAALSEQNNVTELLKNVFSDETGTRGQMYVNASPSPMLGGLDLSKLVSPEMVLGRVGKQIAETGERAKLPTDLDFEPMLASQPYGGGLAKDPTAIESLMAQRDAKRTAFDLVDETEVNKAGATAWEQAHGQAMGKEQADAANFPAQLGRKKDEFSQMTPLEVSRAGRTAFATAEQSELGQQSGQANIISNIAEQVMKNPDLLKDLSPGQRGQVIARINANDQDTYNKRQASIRTLIIDGAAALKNLEGERGFSGAVGAPSLLDPGSLPRMVGLPAMGGSRAAGYGEYINQLKSSLTLPRLEYLRGLGHMSDREFLSVAASVTALKDTMDEPTFRKELKNIKNTLYRAWTAAGLPPQEFPIQGPRSSIIDRIVGQ